MGAGVRGGSESDVSGEKKPGLVDLTKSTAGKRKPGIPKIAADRGNIDKMTTRTSRGASRGVHLVDDKGRYGTPYGDVGVEEYARSFGGAISELDFSNIAGRCDKVASTMAGDAALFLDDDLPGGAGSGESAGGDDGAIPAKYLRLLRKSV